MGIPTVPNLIRYKDQMCQISYYQHSSAGNYSASIILYGEKIVAWGQWDTGAFEALNRKLGERLWKELNEQDHKDLL